VTISEVYFISYERLAGGRERGVLTQGGRLLVGPLGLIGCGSVQDDCSPILEEVAPFTVEGANSDEFAKAEFR